MTEDEVDQFLATKLCAVGRTDLQVAASLERFSGEGITPEREI